MYVCSCHGITEQQVRDHVSAGAGTPRQIASACRAGTDCGSCVRRIQALLGRGAGCAARGERSPVTAVADATAAASVGAEATLESVAEAAVGTALESVAEAA